MTIDVVVPDSMRKTYDRLHFAPAVRENGLIFVSGVIGTGDSAEEEFRDAWVKVGEILTAAGAGYADIVDTTIYLVDIGANTAAMARAKDAFIAAPYPASTWIGISGLVIAGARAEIKVTARCKRG